MQLLVSTSGPKTKTTPQYQQGLVDYIKPSLKARPVSQHNAYGRMKQRNLNVSLNDLNKTTSVFVTPQLDVSHVFQPRLTNSLVFSSGSYRKSQSKNQRNKSSSLRFTGSSFIEAEKMEDKLLSSLNFEEKVTQSNNQELKKESPQPSKEQLQRMYNHDDSARDLAEELIEQQSKLLPSYPKQWMIQQTENLIHENIREIQPKNHDGKKYNLQFCRQSVCEHDFNYNKANKLCGKSQLLQNQYQINKERFKIKYDID